MIIMCRTKNRDFHVHQPLCDLLASMVGSEIPTFLMSLIELTTMSFCIDLVLSDKFTQQLIIMHFIN